MYLHLDDAGQLTHEGTNIKLVGKPDLIKKSYQNYQKLMALNTENDKHFQKYIPQHITMVSEQELLITLYESAYSLTYVLSHFNNKIDQPHVNWILSRILEFATWINTTGYVHCGINLDSLYIVPRNHALVCVSFYHMTKIDQPITTISGRYINMYPSYNIVKKIATPMIDVSCAKKTALFLLGDTSMLGKVFDKDPHYNTLFIDFLKYEYDDVLSSYKAYRNLLDSNYTKKFHEMIINP